jgi:hypothetical protein
MKFKKESKDITINLRMDEETYSKLSIISDCRRFKGNKSNTIRQLINDVYLLTLKKDD